MAPPYRADQVGSLIRPRYLLDARAAYADWLESQKEQKDEATRAEHRSALKAAEQKAIKEVITEQLDRGILPLSSGEFERSIFYGGFFEGLDGLQMRFTEWEKFRPDFPTNRSLRAVSGMRGKTVGVATSKVKYSRSPYLDDWLYIRSLLPEEQWKDVKITLPAPCWWHIQLKDGQAWRDGAYSSDAEFLEDMSNCVRQEVVTLYGAGVRLIQIDDPNLSFFCDEGFVSAQEAEGTDTEALLELYVKSHNDVLSNLPSDLVIGIHLCRGNFPNGVHLGSGAYDRLAKKLFQDFDYKLFYLEYDSERAGSFTPLQHLPRDKAVVLGVVTTKFAEMEALPTLKGRVYEAAVIIAKAQGRAKEEVLQDNLAVSPQCGFASAGDGAGLGMTIERQWQKIELLKALAKDIWPRD